MIRKLGVSLCMVLTACASTPEPVGPPTGQAVYKQPAKPRYPRELAEAGMQGCVLASFLIQPDGRAEKFRVEDSVPPGMFNHAALTALGEARFEAPPRPGRYAQVVNFRLTAAHALKVQRECKPVPSFEELNPEGAKS